MKIRLTILLAVLLLLLSACASAGLDATGENPQLPGTQAPSGTFSGPDPTTTVAPPAPTTTATLVPPDATTPAEPPLPDFADDLNLAMREAYAQLYGKDVGEMFSGTADEVYVETYFGGFGKNHVAFIGSKWFMYSQALWSETLMGLQFRYSDGQKLNVYRDGQMLTLSEAVENGWFTQEELEQLHAVYQAQYPYLYAEEWK